MGEVVGDGCECGLADGDEALLSALACNQGCAKGLLDVGDVEGADFGGAEAAGVEEFEEGAVA